MSAPTSYWGLMFRFIFRRLVVMPFLLFGIVTISFAISRFIPSDPLISIVGERQLNNPVVVAAAKQRWGLDKSIFGQYTSYMGNLVKGDLGISFRTKTPVVGDIIDRLPATFELAFTAMFFGTVGGVLLGVLAASRRNKFADHVSRLFALVGSSLPVFWLGLVVLYVFYARLGFMPGPGRLPPRVDSPEHITGFYLFDAILTGNFGLVWPITQRLLLPAFALGWGLMGIISRLVRSSMLDELQADYVRTARAKGLTERMVFCKHALRNALLPVLTVLGFSIASLLTGAVLTETIFSWNGVGSYAVAATRSLDYPAINGVCILGGIVFLISNLVTDVLYAYADPKIRLT